MNESVVLEGNKTLFETYSYESLNSNILEIFYSVSLILTEPATSKWRDSPGCNLATWGDGNLEVHVWETDHSGHS